MRGTPAAVTFTNLDGNGRQPCNKPNCKHQSVKGLVRGAGKCPFHWAEGQYGIEWASKYYPTHPSTIKANGSTP